MTPLDPERQSSPKPSETENSADKKVGWIEGLAQRSSGLPEGGVKAPQTAPGERSLMSYAGLGIQFAGPIVIFTIAGHELDRRMGWTPWGTVSLAMISVIGGFYLLIKEVMKSNHSGPSPPPDPRRK